MAPDPSENDFGATIRAYAPDQIVFSRFKLVRMLGRGGMGVVWLAYDRRLEREVALKFLPETVAHDPRSVDDLKRETRRSLDLTHPHIVRIYDFFEDQSASAISMVRGKPARQSSASPQGLSSGSTSYRTTLTG